MAQKPRSSRPGSSGAVSVSSRWTMPAGAGVSGTAAGAAAGERVCVPLCAVDARAGSSAGAAAKAGERVAADGGGPRGRWARPCVGGPRAGAELSTADCWTVWAASWASRRESERLAEPPR